MYRGSRKHVLDWAESPLFAPQLLATVAYADAKITRQSAWMPMGYQHPDEATLDEWGPRWFGSNPTWDELRRWWLASPRGANTPNWDIAMVVEIEGRMGLILVEAKAHVSELSTAGKGKPTTSAESRANHTRISEAIDEATHHLRSAAPNLSSSRDICYQLSNRLAFTWKLASLGVPVVLLYLGFVGDMGIADVGEPFLDEARWSKALDEHLSAVGANELFGRRHELGGAPFWMLSACRPVIGQSERAAASVG